MTTAIPHLADILQRECSRCKWSMKWMNGYKCTNEFKGKPPPDLHQNCRWFEPRETR